MRPAVYCRVSTEEQRERQTVETQRQYAIDYCRLNGIPEPRLFIDDGVSGTVPLEERPAGSALLEAARRGDVDTVLVYKLDRLGRSPLIILRAIESLEAAGLQVRSMTEPIDTGTAPGRFLISILGAVAGLERETIIERSMEGTRRLARAGTWLGGLVPYGYRSVGEGSARRLVVSEEPVPGLDLSEAEVIRLMFRWAGEERLSCRIIADRLNQMGVPPAYVRDERRVARGKRKQATAGIWRAARIRNILASSVYRGVHRYGKRSRSGMEVIERPCPAIVTDDLWHRAQQTLEMNRRFSPRNSRRTYLLRGIIRCGLCGLTFIGHASRPYRDGSPRHYYTCNGRRAHRGLYSILGQRCPAPSVEGRAIEEVVKRDILEFLQRPETVLQHLAAEIEAEAQSRERLQRERQKWERALQRTHAERERLLRLFRKNLLTESELEAQFAEIAQEQARISSELERLGALADAATDAEDYLAQAEALLAELRETLHQPLSQEDWRRLVEALVTGITVEPVTVRGRERARVRIVYAFTPPLDVVPATCTGTRAEHGYNITHKTTILPPGRRRKGGTTDGTPDHNG